MDGWMDGWMDGVLITSESDSPDVVSLAVALHRGGVDLGLDRIP